MSYVLLDADEQGYRIQLRRVDYDREAAIKAIEHSRHPTPSFLTGLMRGERVTSSDPGFYRAGKRAENQKRNEREQTTAEGDSGRIITNLATSLLVETTSLRIAWEASG